MLKRFLAKWRIWEEALTGIDDLRGNQLLSLEQRVRQIEQQLAQLQPKRRSETEIEQLLSLDKPKV